MSRKRILILSASVGSGHVAAAEALAHSFRARPDVEEVLVDDSLDHTNVLHKQLYSTLYKQLSRQLPEFLGWWYETSDDPWSADKGRVVLDLIQAAPLINLVRDFRPDSIICTHFMPAGVLSFLIRQGKLKAELGIGVTDFHFHAYWITRAFHWYFVAQEEDKVHMEGLGLPDDPSRLAAMQENARNLGRPAAAESIAGIVMDSPERKPAIITHEREKVLRKRIEERKG